MRQFVISAALLLILPMIGISYIFGPTPLANLAPPAAEPVPEAESEPREVMPWIGWIHSSLPASTSGPRTREGDYSNQTIEAWRQQLSDIREAPAGDWHMINQLSSGYKLRVITPLYGALPHEDIRQNVLLAFQFCLFFTVAFAFIRRDQSRRGDF